MIIPSSLKPRYVEFNFNEIKDLCLMVPGWMTEAELRDLSAIANSQNEDCTWIEIGSYCGRSLLCVALSLPPDSVIYGVDVRAWQCKADTTTPHQSPSANLSIILSDTVETIAFLRPDIQTIVARSSSVQMAKRIGLIDVVFIDGDHSKSAVAIDIDIWQHKSKRLLGHDYMWLNKPNFGVYDAVNEASEKYDMNIVRHSDSIWELVYPIGSLSMSIMGS